MRPESISCQCVGEYRREDLFTYLGLRRLFSATAARTNRFIDEVLVDVALRHDGASFREVKQFKGLRDNGQPEFRALHIPSPSMALAEASLLAALARHLPDGGRRDGVCSYRLAAPDTRRALFDPFMGGVQERQGAITRLCQETEDAVVLLMDIRQYYPSITAGKAMDAWRREGRASNVPPSAVRLGEWLLERQFERSGGAHLLTGPLLSHLIGNLVLRDADEKLRSQYGASYFRYVDDVAIVVSAAQADTARGAIEDAISSAGFELHPRERRDKNRLVCARDWCDGESIDMAAPLADGWRNLIGDLKRLLLARPDQTDAVRSALREEALNLPVDDYRLATRDAEYQQRTASLFGRWAFLRKKTAATTPGQIVGAALALRNAATSAGKQLVHHICTLPRSDHRWKCACTQMRFAATKLIMLGETDVLAELASGLAGVDAMALPAVAMHAVATRDVGEAVRFGRAAAKAVARVLALDNRPVSLVPGRHADDDAGDAGEAVGLLLAHGVQLDPSAVVPVAHLAPVRFAAGQSASPEVPTERAYWNEVQALEGPSPAEANSELLSSAFDVDDEMYFDPDSMLNYAS